MIGNNYDMFLNREEGKINIAEFNDSFFPVTDGVVVLVDNYAKRLNTEKSNCVVVAPKALGYDDSNLTYPVKRCEAINIKKNIYGLPLIDIDLKTRSQVNDFELDICHAHSPFVVGRYGISLAKKKGIPSIISFHSKFYDHIIKTVRFDCLAKLPMAFLLDAYNKADFVWAVSKTSGEVLRSYGFKGEYQVVENGCAISYQNFDDEQRKEFDKKYQICENERVFVFVGQIINHKNIKFSLDALAECKRRGLKFKFLLAGVGYNFAEIKEYAKKLGLSEQCNFIGAVHDREELARIYSRGELFLFPSIYDNAPLVLMEAAACKTPPIVIKGSCAAEKVIDNQNGFVIENDLNYYVNKIMEAINSEKLPQIAENAMTTLGKNFDDVAKEVLERYQDCIKIYNKRK